MRRFSNGDRDRAPAILIGGILAALGASMMYGLYVDDDPAPPAVPAATTPATNLAECTDALISSTDVKPLLRVSSTDNPGLVVATIEDLAPTVCKPDATRLFAGVSVANCVTLENGDPAVEVYVGSTEGRVSQVIDAGFIEGAIPPNLDTCVGD